MQHDQITWQLIHTTMIYLQETLVGDPWLSVLSVIRLQVDWKLSARRLACGLWASGLDNDKTSKGYALRSIYSSWQRSQRRCISSRLGESKPPYQHPGSQRGEGNQGSWHLIFDPDLFGILALSNACLQGMKKGTWSLLFIPTFNESSCFQTYFISISRGAIPEPFFMPEC